MMSQHHGGGPFFPGAKIPRRPSAGRLPERTLSDPAMTEPFPATLFVPLHTERLRLRPYVAADAPLLQRHLNEWEICRNLTEVEYPYSLEMAESWIASSHAQMRDQRAYHLAITGQEGEAEMLVGAISLRLDVAARAAQLGYWVGLRYWGHGVASEAAGRLARWALANLDVDVVQASVVTDNPGSIAVLRRAGFQHVGDAIEYFAARKSEHRVLRFAATRADLFGKPEPEATNDGSKPLLLVAACALVDLDGRVLLARRPEGKKLAGLWEFPGGKLNPGETPEAALIRELKEELGIDVASNCLAAFAFASHGYDSFHLLMPLFLCRRWRGIPQAREGQTLAWVHKNRLSEYAMPEADRPLVPLLRDFL